MSNTKEKFKKGEIVFFKGERRAVIVSKPHLVKKCLYYWVRWVGEDGNYGLKERLPGRLLFRRRTEKGSQRSEAYRKYADYAQQVIWDLKDGTDVSEERLAEVRRLYRLWTSLY